MNVKNLFKVFRKQKRHGIFSLMRWEQWESVCWFHSKQQYFIRGWLGEIINVKPPNQLQLKRKVYQEKYFISGIPHKISPPTWFWVGKINQQNICGANVQVFSIGQNDIWKSSSNKGIVGYVTIQTDMKKRGWVNLNN